MAVLEMKEIFYAYEKGRPVLSNVNTQFDAGKMYAILGPSGSGKTTLLSLIGGLDTPQKGEILFEGGNISQCGLAYHRRNHVSLIFQSYNLIDYMTPIENVALTAKKDALPMLLRLGLTTEETKRNVMKLSGGQQQRVAIARSLGYHHMRQSAVSTGRLGDPITEITWKAGLSFPDLPHSGKRKNCGL